MANKITERGFQKEFKFRTSRSGGKGGQHVNKVSTKVELVFNVQDSQVLTPDEKVLAKERLASKLSSEGDLRIVVEETRSQLKNKEISIERFYKLMEKTLKIPKYRKPTEPSKAAKVKRQKAKTIKSEKKQGRRKVDLGKVEE